jgi:hypothetical protein
MKETDPAEPESLRNHVVEYESPHNPPAAARAADVLIGAMAILFLIAGVFILLECVLGLIHFIGREPKDWGVFCTMLSCGVISVLLSWSSYAAARYYLTPENRR